MRPTGLVFDPESTGFPGSDIICLDCLFGTDNYQYNGRERSQQCNDGVGFEQVEPIAIARYKFNATTADTAGGKVTR